MLHQLIQRLQEASWLSHMSRKLADRCRARVARSLTPRVYSMSRAEARGYIRAKVTPVLLTEFATVLARDPDITRGEQQIILQRSSDLLVREVMETALRGATIELRKAA